MNNWQNSKTIKDIAEAYASIYETKKVDQDQDGDNDFADVQIARMIASGVPKEKAIAMTKNKSYNKEEFEQIDEATAMAKRGYDETSIRKKISKNTGGGEAADRATALADKPTYGDDVTKKARENLARKQRGDFRKTTSSNPGLHGYAHKSDDPAVKAKQAARGAQRGVLTPREKNQLNREAYEAYEIVASYLLENNFAETFKSADKIIENMSENWICDILDEAREPGVKPYSPGPSGAEVRAQMRSAEQKKKESSAGKAGYGPEEKFNSDWKLRVTPSSTLKRKSGETETVSQRMDREKPYAKRMTGELAREYGSRTAAQVTRTVRGPGEPQAVTFARMKSKPSREIIRRPKSDD